MSEFLLVLLAIPLASYSLAVLIVRVIDGHWTSRPWRITR